MSLDVTNYERAIYGFFDVLSDVGGLSDILYKFGEVVVSLISLALGSGIDRELISNLFKIDRKKRK